jgi:hypothetical protein
MMDAQGPLATHLPIAPHLIGQSCKSY